MLKELENILENFPNCRERRVRKKVIGKVLQDKYPHELSGIPISRMEDIIADALYADRLMRDAQLNNEKWRGTDYGEKDKLEDEFQINVLGMEPGFHENNEKLKKAI